MVIDGLIPLFRLWNAGAGDHFYTTTPRERDGAEQLGFADEGVACRVYASDAVDGHPYRERLVPLHRLYNATSKDHLYTTNDGERSSLTGKGWSYEGVAGYVFAASTDDRFVHRDKLVPLYRMYNGANTDHFYTANHAERVQSTPRGYRDEGIIGYVVPADVELEGLAAPIESETPRPVTLAEASAALVPLFRFWSSDEGDHLYTTSEAERDRLAGLEGWQAEGVTARVYPPSLDDSSPLRPHVVPLYRLANARIRDHFYTSNAAERDSVQCENWNSEGIAAYLFPSWLADDHPLRPLLKPLYRLWSLGAGDHFYTVDGAERLDAMNRGWKDEGVVGFVFASTPEAQEPAPAPEEESAMPAPAPDESSPLESAPTFDAMTDAIGSMDDGAAEMDDDASQTAGDPDLDVSACAGTLVPMFRLWSLADSDHLYTTSMAERASLNASAAWRDEGVEGHMITASLDDEHPLRAHVAAVYRMWSAETRDHLYTTHSEEHDRAQRQGWKSEGVIGYAFPAQLAEDAPLKEHLIPLYRLYNPLENDHFYTTVEAERTRHRTQGWRDEGVVGHVFGAMLPNGDSALLAPTHEERLDRGATATAAPPEGGRGGPDATLEASVVVGDESTPGEIEFEQEWSKIKDRIQVELASVDVDTTRDARHWEYLENAILRDFERHIQVLTNEIARLELMFRHHAQTVDTRFDAAFKGWADHFRGQMTEFVSSTVVRIVESQATAAMAKHALKIKSDLSNSLMSDIERRIGIVVDAKLSQYESHITARVERTLAERIDAHVDHKLLVVQNNAVAEIMVQIDALISANVEQKLASAKIEVDVDIDGRVLELQNRFAELRDELNTRMDDGDGQIKAWVSAQLISLKRCVTDRHAFIKALGSFVMELEAKLETTECVDVRRWAKVDG